MFYHYSEQEGEDGTAVLRWLKELGTRIGESAELLQSRTNAAQAMKVSVDSLQRYIRGTTEPTFGAIARLAAATGTSLEWLASGRGARFAEGKPVGAFDPALMQEVIEIVEQLLAEHRRVLPPTKKAELLVTLYEMFKESATPVHRATVLRLVNLAA